MKKRILAVLLTVVLLLGAFPLLSFAEDTLTPSGSIGTRFVWHFDKDTGKLTVKGQGKLPEYTSTGSPFRGKSGIVSVEFGEGVTGTGYWTFTGCTNLKEVIFPSTLTEIGVRAFDGCTSLTKIDLPKSLRSIGNFAFSASALANVTIPKDVNDIGVAPFLNCKKLRWITMLGDGSKYASDKFGVLYACSAGVKTELLQFPAGSGYVGFNVPDTVTRIGDYAFAAAVDLEAVTIPDSVRLIDDCAFKDCAKLKTVGIGSGVKTISRQAFFGCVSLRDAYTFGGEAWHGAVSVKENNGPLLDSLVHMNCEFGPCGPTQMWFLDEDDGELRILGEGKMDDYDYDMNPSPFSSSAVTDVVIGEKVSKISDWAFFDCDNLESIAVESADAVLQVKDNALLDAEGKRIFAYPFACEATAFTVPDGVTDIAPGAFAKADNLRKLTLPVSLKTVGYGAFEYCTRLGVVLYHGDMPLWAGITIEDANDPLTSAARTYTIQSIYLTVTAPALGEKPQADYPMSGRELLHSTYTVPAVEWSPTDETFAADVSYTVTLTVKPKTNYTFPLDLDNIKVFINGLPASCRLDPRRNRLTGETELYLRASLTFEPLQDTKDYAVTVENGSADHTTAKKGETVTVKADPAPEGKVFDKWVVTAGGLTLADPTKASLTFTMPAADVSLRATYKDAPVTVRRGDVDNDGKITAADARLALRRAVELENYAPGTRAFLACDVDHSNTVTAADARLILRGAVELEDPNKW